MRQGELFRRRLFHRLQNGAVFCVPWQHGGVTGDNFLQKKPARCSGFFGLTGAAVKLMRTSIRLLAEPKSMRSIIDATQREQLHGLA